MKSETHFVWQQRIADWAIVAEVESGVYEQHVRVREGDVILDGGAQIGWFTKQVVERAAHVYAFETNPDNLKLLYSNMVPFPHVEVFPHALWFEDVEEHPFWINREHVGAGAMWDIGEYLTERVVTVKAVALDNFNPRLRFDFAKLDVECSELNVLRGGAETFAACRPVIAMEAHPPAEGHEKFWDDLVPLLPPDYEIMSYPKPGTTWMGRITTMVPKERSGEIIKRE